MADEHQSAGTSRNIEFEKRTIAPGWTELRLVIARPDTPDYRAVGHEAALAIAHFVLSFASGLGQSQEQHAFARACRELYERLARQTKRATSAQH